MTTRLFNQMTSTAEQCVQAVLQPAASIVIDALHSALLMMHC
jgi:hypothetical protein